MTKSFRESLPWLVPSAAIIFGAATLYLDRGLRDAGAEERSAIATAKLEELVARQSTLTETFETMPEAVALATPELPEPAPPVAAAREPLRPAVVAAPMPVFKPPVETTNAVCLDDLRKLTEAVRVYFSSGGLNADQAGIENAHIIALIAQSCPGVRIRVQGHSDASGDPEANLRLSLQRAEEVVRRIAAAGTDTGMFIAEGMGDKVPSGLDGPMPPGHYDRRVEFVLEEVDQRTASIAPVAVNPFASARCVTELEAAARGTTLFYTPRAVSLPPSDVDIALALARQAVACPHARLRMVGHHSGDVHAGESPATARLRTKALMAMLVARGVPSEQIIMASPSVPWRSADQAGMPGCRVDFEIILEDG